MKKILIGFTVWMFVLVACAPAGQPTQEPLIPNEDAVSDLTPAQQAAITALSTSLNLPPKQITLVSTEAVNWPDGCLGIQRTGVMCTQAIVPGYKITLEVNGTQYEFHTNENGSQAVQVPNASLSGALEEMLIKQLASNLGLKESDISVVSSAEVDFTDACLGVAMQEVECAQVSTPGKIIVLESKDMQYEYHVSNDGARVQPATLALTWSRTGGFAGFCDRLTIFLSGEIYGSQCRSQPGDGVMGTFADLLSQQERQQLDKWLKALGQVSVDASDPKGVADGMEVKLEFYGLGKGTLNQINQQDMLLWAQTVFQKLFS